MSEQPDGDVCYLQFTHYRQFPELIHGVFTRTGGYSTAPFHSLNTSRGQKIDSVENVVRNRMRALETLGIAEMPCVTLWQVHGSQVITLDPADEWRTDWAYHSYFETGWTPPSIRQGDALITQAKGAAIALSFADCVPIVLYDPTIRALGIAHGGWRGTARGIVIETVMAMRERFGCQPENIYAGLGPAIGPCCYEVSEQVQQYFIGDIAFDTMPTRQDYTGMVRESAVFSTLQLADKESLRLDLPATNRKQLLMAGLCPANIEAMEICTSCNTDRFFSHRAENGLTGRFAVILALRAES